MVQIDTGMTPSTWATDANNNVYELKGNDFTLVPGKLSHVTSGAAGVWGVTSASHIYYRDVVTNTWKIIPGGLKQIDSGPKGIVCGVSSIDEVFCRTGITDATPEGSAWMKLDGSLKYISCGEFGHWGVNKNNQVFFREGIFVFVLFNISLTFS